jgi:hypothetical protein
MSSKLGKLKICLIFLVFAIFLSIQSVSAYDATVVIAQTDLPYSDIITLDIPGEINNTMNVTYDNWLSGLSTIVIDDPLYQLDVTVDIPE